ncbi:MAG: amino acid ABC transporter ATP-binding protein [Erysipelotrichaceae bacterium]
MLEVKNIAKHYGSHSVFENLSFQVLRGEIVVLQGKSGIGKTTLLRCINDLETLDQGDILIDGVSIRNRKKHQLPPSGMVFQQFALFPNLNVFDNVMLAARYHGLESYENLKDQAFALLENLHMSHALEQFPATLSGGEKQRVAIARACMVHPKVLCFDEPTSALDQTNRDEVIQMIQAIAQTGVTILIVTHDERFAKNIATRTITMSKNNEKKMITPNREQ